MRSIPPTTPLRPAERGIYSDLVTEESAGPFSNERHSEISPGMRTAASPSAGPAEFNTPPASEEVTNGGLEEGEEEAGDSGDGAREMAADEEGIAAGEEPAGEGEQGEEPKEREGEGEAALILRGGGARLLGQAESDDGLFQVFERPTMPLPNLSRVRLPREDLDVEVSAPAFDAPTTLRHKPAREAEELSPELTGYAGLFMQAASSAQRLYTDVLELARRATSEARADEERRAAKRQMTLDMSLAELDTKLAEARLDLSASRELCLAMFETRVASAKFAIRRTAGRATGALRARANRIESDITNQRGLAATIRAMPPNKRNEIERAKTAAWAGMDGLVSNPSTLRAPASGDQRPAMMSAKNEALALNIHFPVAEAKLELTPQVDQMKEGAMAQLPSAESSLCNAFCPFEDWKAMLRGEAIEKVGTARATSLDRFKAMAREARENLVRTFDEAEKSLIEQHDSARQSLAESSSQRARAEREQAQVQAQDQAATLAAVAGAQPTAVKSIDRMIGDQVDSEENDFARSVINYARGLLTNGLPTGRRQFGRAIDDGERALGRIGQVSEAANNNFLKAGSRAGEQLLASAETTAQNAERSIEETSKRMLRLADPIRNTMEGFLNRVSSQFATQVGTLQSSLQGLQTKITNAYSGASSNDGNDTNTEHPPADAGASAPPGQCRNSCPAPPQPSESQGGGGERETTKAFIARLKSYGTDPQTERNIAQFIRTIPETVSTDLSGRATRLNGLLGMGDSNPYGVLDELRGLTRRQAAAVEEGYGGPGELRSDLDTYLNIGNLFTSPVTRIQAIRAARAYLNGNTELGVIHELNIATHLWNDSDRIDRVMQDLTPAQMRSMNANYGTALEEIRSDLNELDAQVFQDLRNERVGSALARRLRASIDEARETRGDSGADAAVDAIAASFDARGGSRLSGADQFKGAIEGARSREARQAESWDAILTGFAAIQEAGPEDQSADSESRGRALITYATAERTYNVYVQDESNPYREHPTGHWETRREGVSAAQRRLIENLVRYGEGSAEARAARMVVELGRPGGAKPDRVRIATDDPELNAGVVDARTLVDAQARQEEMYRLIQQYAPGEIEGGDGEPTVEQIRRSVASRLAAGVRNDPRRAAYLEHLVTGNPDDPESVIARLDYAMEGAGTNNEVLRQTLGTLTREQFEAVRELYDEKHDPDLLVRLGIRGQGNWWQSETSGDTANDLEVLSLGIPRNDRERAEVAALRMHQQIDQAGWLGEVLAGEEHSRLTADYRRLMSVMGADDVGFDANGNFVALDANDDPVTLGRFNDDGEFVPPSGFSHEDLALAMTIGQISAENYKAATDRIADSIATALVVTAAIVTTALTGGAAASIWIPVLVTAAAGVASMGVKYAIKGGRYGSEEMMLDLASTIVLAATAGIGAAAGAALRGGSKAAGALATNMRLSEQALAAAATGATATRALPGLKLGQELFIGALSSGFAGGANAAINPDSYRSDNYASDILHGIVRGSVSGAIGAGVTRGVAGGMGSLARKAGAASGAREALSRGASLDAAARLGSLRSRLYGTSALTDVGSRALASGVSGMVSRGVELGYDRTVMGKNITWNQAIDDLGAAFIQNLVQGFGEGAVDRMIRNYSATRRAEHDFTIRDDAADFRQRGRAAMETEARRMGLLTPDGQFGDGVGVAPRPTMGVDERGALVTNAEPEGPIAVRTADEPTAQAARRADGEAVEPPARLRSALGDDEGPARLRSGSDFDDEVTKPGIRIQHPEFPDGVNLSPGALDRLPPILPDTVVRGVDPTDGAQARQNYDIMRARTPDSEVLLAFNPTTGEYMAVQGLPRSVTPPPEGWITLRHSHPRVIGGDEYSHFASILPSGIGGDFSVLRTEVDRLAAANPHVEVRRASTIDIEVNGQHVQTVFEITKSGDNYSLSVTLHPPQYGVDRIGPVFGDRDGALREYAYKARDLTANGSDFGLGHNKTSGPDLLTESGRPDAPSRVVRGVTLGETERADVAFVAGRMAHAENFEAQIAGRTPRGEIDPSLGRRASLNDAIEAVSRLGLVNRPDAAIRLTAVLNDPALPDAVKPLVARAVLEATREAMIRTGKLASDDELLMFFRGASSERLEDYRRRGIDPTLAKSREEDVGPGLYMSQDLESAKSYGGEASTILPFIVRRSDLGNVLDISPGSPLRARWEHFVAENWMRLRVHGATAQLLGRPGPRDPSEFGFFWFEKAGRVVLYDEFRKTIAADPDIDPAVRRAAADPDIVLTDLGGPVTYGNDRGFMTDQAAMKTRRLANLMNEQLGFPRVGPDEAQMSSGRGPARTADTDDAEAALARQVDEDVERAFAATFDQSIRPETDAQRRQRASREAARAQATDEAIEGAVRRFIAADGPDRVRQVQGRVLRKIMTSAPEAAGAILRSLGMGTAQGGGRVLSATQESALIRGLTAGGMPQPLAERYARAFGTIVDANGPLHRLVASAVERVAWGDAVGGLQQRAEGALDQRLLLLAARQFAAREGRESAGPRFKEIFHKDQEAVMAFLSGTVPVRERMRAFTRARRVAGASPGEVARDVESLVAALRDNGLQETVNRWRDRYQQAGITVDDLDQLVRDHPDVLLMTARASPDQLAEFLARRITELLPEKHTSNRDIAALEFLASFVRGQETGVRPLASELEAVRLLAGTPIDASASELPFMNLLTAGAVDSGRTNQGGFDIVGFQMLPAAGGEAEHTLQIVVVDDKAVNADVLNSASALTGERLRVNLILAANETARRATALQVAGTPEMQAFAGNALQAATEMYAAAAKLRGLTIPSSSDEAAMQAYHLEVARILDEHHIALVITSEYGAITRLQEWMTRQGIRTYPEYLRWLRKRQSGR